jgi:hypothetical protein
MNTHTLTTSLCAHGNTSVGTFSVSWAKGYVRIFFFDKYWYIGAQSFFKFTSGQKCIDISVPVFSHNVFSYFLILANLFGKERTLFKFAVLSYE